MAYNRIAKLIKMQQENDVANKFLQDLLYTIEKENENDYIPTKAYKPSGIAGCKRGLYFQMTGVKPDIEPSSVELVGICESGTDRHEVLQDYIKQVGSYTGNCKWLNVAKYLHEHNITDPQVVSQNGNETKLFSKKYNMRFMCDGLIQYRDEYYILEIKTESSLKFSRHDEPWKDHKMQAACYAMCIGVPRVIFLYENRDNCTKKAFLYEVPQSQIDYIEQVINYVDRCVEEHKVPPKEPDKCTYCNYKGECRRIG